MGAYLIWKQDGIGNKCALETGSVIQRLPRRGFETFKVDQLGFDGLHLVVDKKASKAANSPCENH